MGLSSMGLSKWTAFLVVPILLITAGSFWGWCWWRKERRLQNDTFAARARSTLVRAQFGYLEQQYKSGGEPQPWTKDIAGLYPFGLIDRELAEADDRAVNPLGPKPVPIHGYYVRFLPL